MSNPAARATDSANCPVHGKMTVILGSPDVYTNGVFQARATDICICTGGVASHIPKGSATVRTNALPTAHVGEAYEHGAWISSGSPNVRIGGPDAAVSGSVAAGKNACAALKATRHIPGHVNQCYGNCSVETMRQMINAYRAAQGLPPMTEDQALAVAIANGANPTTVAQHRGGMTVAENQAMMEKMGYPCDVNWDPSPEDIANNVPCLAMVHANDLWGTAMEKDNHAVMITGVERDADGNIVGYYINDTGIGDCGRFIPAAQMARARRPMGDFHMPIMVPKQKPF